MNPIKNQGIVLASNYVARIKVFNPHSHNQERLNDITEYDNNPYLTESNAHELDNNNFCLTRFYYD